jgi:hypothetical protein
MLSIAFSFVFWSDLLICGGIVSVTSFGSIVGGVEI